MVYPSGHLGVLKNNCDQEHNCQLNTTGLILGPTQRLHLPHSGAGAVSEGIETGAASHIPSCVSYFCKIKLNSYNCCSVIDFNRPIAIHPRNTHVKYIVVLIWGIHSHHEYLSLSFSAPPPLSIARVWHPRRDGPGGFVPLGYLALFRTCFLKEEVNPRTRQEGEEGYFIRMFMCMSAHIKYTATVTRDTLQIIISNFYSTS